MTGPAPRFARLLSRPAIRAGLVAFGVGLAAQVWAHRTGVVFAFWDAQAHLDIARRVIDSVTPGLQMLGTVWLPVPHLLLLPFTQVNAWWWNGTAGGIVGLAAFVIIVACVHDLLVRRTGRPVFAWIGTALVVLNPSLLYLQTTAMTEPVLLAFMVASVAALDRWAESGSLRALMVAALAAALAVGSRYDGWFFILIAGCWLIAVPRRAAQGTPVHRWRDALILVLPSALVVAAWLGYNWRYFGDPLEFQRGIWSAQSQQTTLAARGLLPTAGRPDISLLYYLGAVILCAGPVLAALGLASAAGLLRVFRATGMSLVLFTALPFNVLTLWARQSTIQLPWSSPAGALNLRYGIMLLPGLAVALSLALSMIVARRPAWRRGMLLAGLLIIAVQAAWFAVNWPAHAGALREGLAIRDGDKRQQRASDWLRNGYDGGRVLVDEAVNLSPRTRIPLRDRIYSWTWQLGPAALAAPEHEVDWVIVDEQHANGVVAHAIANRDDFRNRFDRTFDDGGLEIWRRR